PAVIVQQLVAQLSWGHNIILLDKVESEKREWYAKKTLENGWSRNVMVHQIETRLYDRILLEGKTHNFTETLPKIESELAVETLKDPYLFDFLNLSETHLEKELEDKNSTIAEYALRDNIKPIGISEYRLSLPSELASELPSLEELTRLGENLEIFSKNEEILLEYLKKKGKITAKTSAEILRLSDRRSREILKEMQNKKAIEKIGNGRQTCYILVGEVIL
ncbi:MAG: DUF1016 N-terminal domain-containing protein, partial [Fusobacteriaceae bacterium]